MFVCLFCYLYITCALHTLTNELLQQQLCDWGRDEPRSTNIGN